jgi:hypothetical protein
MSIKIEVEGYEAEQALDRAMELAVRQAVETQRSKISEVVEEEVRGAVAEKLKSITEEMIRGEVVRTLTEGWPRTNNYGEAVGGEPLTLKSKVLEMLTKRKDNYNNNQLVDDVIRDEISKALREKFGQELEAARAKMQALIDGTISDKMRDMLKGLFR